MFDPNQFDKYSKQIQAELEAISNKAVNSIAESFSKLPKKLAETFQTGEMEKMLRISIDIGKSFENLAKEQKELAKSKDVITDFIKKHDAERIAIEQKRVALKKTQDEYKELNAIYGSQYDEIAKISKQLSKNTIDRKALVNVINAEQTALDGVIKRQAEVERQLQQTNTVAKITKNILTDIALVVLNQVGKSFLAFRAAGFDALQTVGQGTAILGAQWSGVMHGVLGSTAEYAAALGGLANQLGTLEVPKGVVAEAVRLTTQFGLSQAAADHLNAQITRMNNYSGVAAANVNKMAVGFAVANKMAPGQIFKDMAEQSEIFATYAGRGAGEFIKSAIAVRQMGTSLQSMSGFADRLVDDFEGSLKMQAEVQTVLPGMDFSQIMYASQFGTEKDVAEALKRSLQATGVKSLDQLPRSTRNLLQKSLGLSKEELQNLMGAGAPEGVKAAVDVNMAGRSVGNVVGDKLGSLIGSQKSLEIALGLNTAALIANTFSKGIGGLGGIGAGLIGGAKGLFGKIGGLFGRGGMAAAAEGAEGIAAKSIIEGGAETAAIGGTSEIPILGALLGGGTAFGLSLMNHEGLGKALFRGAGAGLGSLATGWFGAGALGGIGGDIGGGALYDSIFGHSTAVAGGGMSMPGAAVPMATEGVSQGVQQTNQAVIHLLQQILAATRDGKNIYIDGKKLSDSLVVAHSRG